MKVIVFSNFNKLIFITAGKSFLKSGLFLSTTHVSLKLRKFKDIPPI